jgi:hypothetical protein
MQIVDAYECSVHSHHLTDGERMRAPDVQAVERSMKELLASLGIVYPLRVRPDKERAGSPATAAAPASVTTGPVPEREARVHDAVRALGQATASEVAERTGQPNGSVVVALRALVARGLVARTKSERGVEYSLPMATAVA